MNIALLMIFFAFRPPN